MLKWGRWRWCTTPMVSSSRWKSPVCSFLTGTIWNACFFRISLFKHKEIFSSLMYNQGYKIEIMVMMYFRRRFDDPYTNFVHILHGETALFFNWYYYMYQPEARPSDGYLPSSYSYNILHFIIKPKDLIHLENIIFTIKLCQ